jgi:polar amino acid transport system substrate-binding protein
MRVLIAAGLVWAVTAIASWQGKAAEPCDLSVGWEPYAPYTFADENGDAAGADIDLITAIAHEIGCTVTPVELPWARILREVQQGTLDVSTSTSETPEREAWGRFSEPYREAQVAIYVRKGESGHYDLQSLADVPAQQMRLGVIVDYYYGDVVAGEISRPEVVAWIDGAPDYPTNIRKLVNGRIDGFLAEDVAVMDTELERMGLADRVERYPLRIQGEKLHFMFSRETVAPDLVAKVDATLEQMRADGRLDAIMNAYFP